MVAEVEVAKARRRAKEVAVQRYRDAAVGWTNALRGLLIVAGLRETAEELPATSPRRQASSTPVGDSLPDEGDLPAADDLPPLETPEPSPGEDLPIPANEPLADDVETA